MKGIDAVSFNIYVSFVHDVTRERSSSIEIMKRDNYWDTLKWVLMMIVVFGHLLGPANPAGSTELALHNIIYLFHMPLFIFVSGRFAVVHDCKRYVRSILRLLETLLVFQIFFSILSVAGGERPLKDCLLCPYFALWYLLSLVYWRLMVLLIPKKWLLRRKGLTVALCFVVSVAAGLIPVGRELSVQRTLSFLPFFMLGYVTAGMDVKAFVKRMPIVAAVGILVAIVALVFYMHRRWGMFVCHMLYYSFPYYTDTSIQLYRCVVARVICLAIAIVMGAAVMRLVMPVTLPSKWGSSTLFVYITHIYAVNYVILAACNQNMLPGGLWWLVLYAVALTPVLSLLAQVKYSEILLNPISALIGRMRKKENSLVR